MRNLFWIALFLGFIGGVSQVCTASETDGYYCSGIGYIAYDLGIGTEHELRIVTFGGRIGISEPTRIPLTAFQTAAMRCDSGMVHIASDNAIWSVNISVAGGSPIKMKKISPGKIPNGFVVTNLGPAAKKGRTRLESIDSDRRYELEIQREKKRTDGMIDTSVKSSLIEKEGRSEQKRVVLYENHFSAVDE